MPKLTKQSGHYRNDLIVGKMSERRQTVQSMAAETEFTQYQITAARTGSLRDIEVLKAICDYLQIDWLEFLSVENQQQTAQPVAA